MFKLIAIAIAVFSFTQAIFTATNRQSDPLAVSLHKAAYTGGIDFLHQWKDRTYYIEGNVIGSRVQGTPEAIKETQESIVHMFQRSDATHVSLDPTKTSMTGTGGKLVFGKGAGLWQYSMGGNWRSPELELNDVGFLRETDLIRQAHRHPTCRGMMRYQLELSPDVLAQESPAKHIVHGLTVVQEVLGPGVEVARLG